MRYTNENIKSIRIQTLVSKRASNKIILTIYWSQEIFPVETKLGNTISNLTLVALKQNNICNINLKKENPNIETYKM